MDKKSNQIKQLKLANTKIGQQFKIKILEHFFGKKNFQQLDFRYTKFLLDNFDDKYELIYDNAKLFCKFVKIVRKDLTPEEVIKFFMNEKSLCERAVKNQYYSYLRYYLELINMIEIDCLPEEHRQIAKDLRIICAAYRKENIFKHNKHLNCDFVKYIYPLVGLELSVDLLKYDTNAICNILAIITDYPSDLVTWYIDFYQKHDFFDNNSRAIHYAFQKINGNFLNQIKNRENELTDEDIDSLKRIIYNQNFFKISTFDELKNYKKIKQEKIKEIMADTSFYHYSDIIRECLRLGFHPNNIINYYGLDNVSQLAYLYKEIKKHYGEVVFKEVMFTKEELTLIRTLKEAFEKEKVKDSFELLRDENGNYEIDYSVELRTIIKKARRMHELEINIRLSDINDFEHNKQVIDGVSVIEIKNEEFNFLVHRLYNYDDNLRGFDKILENNPNLWDKLEGSSTLSTSGISNKVMALLREGGVIYVFNQIPENSLLYMDLDDLGVQHGKSLLEPNAGSSDFRDWESLNHRTLVHGSWYNEVALYRENIMPCAFLSLDNEISDATKKAAKYFSTKLNKDIPIILVNQYNLGALEEAKTKKAKKNLYNHINVDDCVRIIFSSPNYAESINYIVDCLLNHFNNKSITTMELIKYLVMIQKVIKRFTVGEILGFEPYQSLEDLTTLIAVMGVNDESKIFKMKQSYGYGICVNNHSYRIDSFEKFEYKYAKLIIANNRLKQRVCPNYHNCYKSLNAHNRCTIIGEINNNDSSLNIDEYFYDYWFKKFLLDFCSFNYTLLPIEILKDYQDNRIDLDLDVIRNMVDNLVSLSDEEYLNIFADYLNTYDDSKQSITKLLLDKKHNAKTETEELLQKYEQNRQYNRGRKKNKQIS